MRGGGGRLQGRAGGGLVGRGRAAVRGAGVTLHRQLQLHEYLNTTNELSIKVDSSVADPDPSDPNVFGLLDPDPLVKRTDPDPSIIKQK